MTPDQERWRAVAGRIAAADGTFVYAVATTGVFCRPSCPSRLPLAKNVRFFESPRDAERAGYRACKRCRPALPNERNAAVAAIVTACRRLERGAAATTALARSVGLSTAYFCRLFRRQVGLSPQEYRRRVVAERARAALGRAATVSEAAYAAGYGSSSRFYAGVGQELGMSPSQLRRGSSDGAVKYALRHCALGRLLIAWTHRGVSDVSLGDDDDALIDGLRSLFRGQELARQHRAPAFVDAVVRAVETSRGADIPLDIQGTAFQERVWRELRKIPAGKTLSYAALAAAIGRPSSTRAVAGACAANRHAVIVPCHRVVRSDGDLASYRWGRERKALLLAREGGDGARATSVTADPPREPPPRRRRRS